MAATNHTTNYNLPQYIGTDKPTYLGDWNSAMSAIDTQMKTNADNASGALSAAQTAQTNANTALSTAQGADTKADTALTNAAGAQSTADNASSVASSALSTANSANTAAQTAQSTADSASASATSANTKAEAIASKLSLTSFETIQYSNMTKTGNGTLRNGAVYTATNADGSIGKVYGQFTINANASSGKITIPTQLRPKDSNGDPTDLTVNGVAMRYIVEGTTWKNIDLISMTIKANGNVEVDYTHNNSAQEVDLFIFYACILFLTPFNDEPIIPDL